MDAYNVYQKIHQLWQQGAMQNDAASIKKNWAETPVYVNGKRVVDVVLKDGKIVLETE